jgi:preprotein translocase subunit SecA
MNTQRLSIYERRRATLMGTDGEVEDLARNLLMSNDIAVQEFEIKKTELGMAFTSLLRQILLQIIDMFWLEHLETMDYLRRSVSLRAYGQRDPLIEYRREGLQRFRALEESIRGAFAEAVPRLKSTDDASIRAEQEKIHLALSGVSKEEGSTILPIVKSSAYGRNDFITIKKGNDTQTLKFKKAEPLLHEGWEIVETTS